MKLRSNNDIRPIITDPSQLIPEPQLELGFDAVPLAPGQVSRQPGSLRQRPPTRAQWWFQRMRQFVDRAFDWQPAPPPRPEQIWFPSACRQPAYAPSPAVQRQICE